MEPGMRLSSYNNVPADEKAAKQMPLGYCYSAGIRG